MTINEQHRLTADHKTEPGDNKGVLSSSHALVDRLNAGEPYAVAFGGQGAAWLENLEELVSSAGIESELSAVVGEAELLLEPVARELVVVRPIGFEPLQWVRALAAEEPLPATKQLITAAISGPGILLAQMAAIRALTRQGLDLYGTPPVAMAGHSQGIMACESLRAKGTNDAELLALLQLIGAAGSLVSRRRGMVGRGDKSPMVSVTNVDPDRIAELLEEFSQDVRTVLPPVLSIRNGRRSVVITGTPEQLGRFELYCSKITEKEEAERKSKLRGGAVFSPVFHGVQVEVGFHTPRLADGVDVVDGWAEKCGIDAEMAHEMTEAIFVRPIDWVAEVERLHDSGAKLDHRSRPERHRHPPDRAGHPRPGRRHRSGGHPRPDSATCSPSAPRPRCAPAWSSYAPTAVKLPDGSVKLSTKFTRLTGRSPILLAGMTPTTVDAKIVAAAANAGHWAELAGGGQVTEEVFENRIAELTGLLEPGRAVQFNTLFLDPYLWKLQVGGKRLVQRARQSGAPIDGVVVSAGIPELEEAVELIDELNSVGISHVVFKPGTVDQIKSVIKIAAEVPGKDVIVHIEGGRAGGHHSWEDLDDLLLATYAELRKLPNITVCVGGGVGTPERAAEYLSGRWAEYYGFPAMPVDGILVGTAAMATLESTTSPSVKQMLVETNGTDHWISAGKAQGGMASSRSQLGADIHEIDNTASRCGRLLDEVAGDAEAVAARRDEIIAAMANTAKPYFGDVGEMTYLQWLQRYVELTIGDGDSTADTAAPGSPWVADTWRDRFDEMLKRAEARLHPQDSGPIETLFDDRGSAAGQSGSGDRDAAGALSRRRDPQAAPGRCAVLRHAVQDAGQAGQLRARHRQGRAALVAQRLAVAGPRRPLLRRSGVHHSGHAVGGRHHPRRRAGRRTAGPLRAGRRSTRCWRRAGSRAGGLPPPGSRRRHRPARGGARLARCAVGRPHRHQPGAPHRRARRVAGQRKPQRHTPIHGCPAGAERRWRGDAERPAVGHLDRHPVHAAVLHGRRRHAGRHRRGRVDRDAVGAGHRRRRRRARLPAAGARQHRQGHRRLGSRAGRRPHRCHRHVRRSAGTRPHPGARRAGRPLLARGVRRDRLGRHRRRIPGRRGSAEPGAPGPRRAPADADADDRGRIDRHRNGFGGDRHRVRPGYPGFGDHHATPTAPSWPRWRSGSRSAAAPAPPSSPIRRAPAARSPTTRPTRRGVAAATSPSPRRRT